MRRVGRVRYVTRTKSRHLGGPVAGTAAHHGPHSDFLVSLTLGRYHVSLGEIFTVFGNKLHLTERHRSIKRSTRSSWVCGCRASSRPCSSGPGLSLSGGAYQGMFRNPLVSPDILGASAGAGFGAALGIMLSKSVIVTQFLALGFGLAAVLVTYFLAGRLRARRSHPLPGAHRHPGGHGVHRRSSRSSRCSPTPTTSCRPSPSGSWAAWPRSTRRTYSSCPVPMVVGGAAVMAVRWHLNPLSFGEEEAQAMGTETAKLRAVIIGGCTLMTASAVSVAGIIGWVGLIIPHVARGIVGPDYGRLLPVSAVIGAVYLLARRRRGPLGGPLELPSRHPHRAHRCAVLPAPAGPHQEGLVVILELSGVSCGYGQRTVLSDVNLTVSRGRTSACWAPTVWARPRCSAPSWGHHAPSR